MFAPLGLFKDVPCPEGQQCSLLTCIFSHDPVSPSLVNPSNVQGTPVAPEEAYESGPPPKKPRLETPPKTAGGKAQSLSGGSHIPHDRLRLRTVSRKRKSPIDEASNTLHKPEFTDDNGNPMDHGEERFTSRGIHMWPPENAPAELTQLLCPSHRIGKVQAVADERSIIYSIDQEGLCGGNQAIVLINFDPVIRHPGLKRLTLDSGVRPWGPNSDHATAIRPLRQQERTMLQTPVSTARANQAVPSVREEPAMYLSINHGYWLR